MKKCRAMLGEEDKKGFRRVILENGEKTNV